MSDEPNGALAYLVTADWPEDWTLVAVNQRHNGPQLLFRFPNGFGASVIGEIDFDRWTSSILAPPPLLAGEVEVGIVRWADGDYQLTDVQLQDEEYSDQIRRHVYLHEVPALFERIAALPTLELEW